MVRRFQLKGGWNEIFWKTSLGRGMTCNLSRSEEAKWRNNVAVEPVDSELEHVCIVRQAAEEIEMNDSGQMIQMWLSGPVACQCLLRETMQEQSFLISLLT